MSRVAKQSAKTDHPSGIVQALDASQKQFCSVDVGAVRLLAPAGWGKTHSLLWRCLALAATPSRAKPHFIVTLSQRLIAHNRGRVPRDVKTNGKAKAEVVVRRFASITHAIERAILTLARIAPEREEAFGERESDWKLPLHVMTALSIPETTEQE